MRVKGEWEGRQEEGETQSEGKGEKDVEMGEGKQDGGRREKGHAGTGEGRKKARQESGAAARLVENST